MSTLSDAAIVDLYWRTTGDDWAIPEEVMIKFARAIEVAAVTAAANEAESYRLNLPARSPLANLARDIRDDIRKLAEVSGE